MNKEKNKNFCADRYFINKAQSSSLFSLFSCFPDSINQISEFLFAQDLHPEF
jgi:hypothetical protein